MKYDVLREHLGEQMYAKGEERDAEPARVAHLVMAGVLRERGGKARAAAQKSDAKAASAPQNKAQAPVQNKAAK